jgi:small conductance mechanosensitive channel
VDFGAVWDETKESLAAAYRDLVEFAIAAVEAVVVVLVATFVARWLKRRVRRALERSRLEPNAAALVVTGAAIATYLVAATFVLGLFGANWTALLALLSVATLAVSLALQDVLKNFVAGVYLLLERPFSIGDRIRVKDVTGRVVSIDFRTTVLQNEREERVYVPNATVFGEIVINRSAPGAAHATLRLTGIAAPLPELREAVAGVARGVDGLREPGPRVELAAAGEEGAEATLSLWHETDADVVPALVARLRERFPEATVTVGEE